MNRTCLTCLTDFSFGTWRACAQLLYMYMHLCLSDELHNVEQLNMIGYFVCDDNGNTCICKLTCFTDFCENAQDFPNHCAELKSVCSISMKLSSP